MTSAENVNTGFPMTRDQIYLYLHKLQDDINNPQDNPDNIDIKSDHYYNSIGLNQILNKIKNLEIYFAEDIKDIYGQIHKEKNVEITELNTFDNNVDYISATTLMLCVLIKTKMILEQLHTVEDYIKHMRREYLSYSKKIKSYAIKTWSSRARFELQKKHAGKIDDITNDLNTYTQKYLNTNHSLTDLNEGINTIVTFGFRPPKSGTRSIKKKQTGGGRTYSSYRSPRTQTRKITNKKSMKKKITNKKITNKKSMKKKSMKNNKKKP